MRLLLLTTLFFLIPVTSIATETNAGEMLYKSRCGLCHQLPEPSMLTAKQWRIVLETMQKRMGHIEMPPLSENEREQILSYLGKHAKRH